MAPLMLSEELANRRLLKEGSGFKGEPTSVNSGDARSETLPDEIAVCEVLFEKAMMVCHLRFNRWSNCSRLERIGRCPPDDCDGTRDSNSRRAWELMQSDEVGSGNIGLEKIFEWVSFLEEKNETRQTPPRSPSPTAVHSTNRLTVRGSILGPWSARPKWASMTASFLAVAQNEGKVILKATLKPGSPTLPRVLFSFFPTSLAARCQSRSFVLLSVPTSLSLRCYSLLDLLLFALNCHLCHPLLPWSPSRANGSKTYRRRMPPNSSAERVGTGAQ
jgi:hypothetical protein